MKKVNQTKFEKNQNYKRTIEKPVKVEYIEKKSKFIAQAFPVVSIDEVEQYLNYVRKEFSDASHHCYAFVIGIDKSIFRFSDDGEPSGTAGKPIFQMIMNFDLTDVLVVVTRYFGGIKLGASGLVRAYATATKLVLENAEIIEVPQETILYIEIDYSNYARIKNYIYSELKSINETFSDKVEVTGKIPTHLKESFINKLKNLLSGEVMIKWSNYENC